MTTLTADRPSVLSEPQTVKELGVDRGSLRDLTVKMLFYMGRMTRVELADELKLSISVVEELMHALTQEVLATVIGGVGGTQNYTYTLTAKGNDRAERAISRSGYVGPAPVPLGEYIAQVEAQSVSEASMVREQIAAALGSLILSDQTVTRIGRAATSRKPTLVYGASGNGKTTVVRALGGEVGGTVYVPYAIESMGQVINVYDQSKHERVDDDDAASEDLLRARPDRRWTRIKRPVIWAGGELTRHSLELVYDDQSKVYEAPLQLKANGGTLIIDDFGRQQMPAVQLLNRWIVALEGGRDHLTMHTGQMIEVPFNVMVLFSTNLPPDRLADEAFLRRIRYKVEIPNPTQDEFRRIFRRECESAALPYDDSTIDYLFERWYDEHHREIRGCHPRDIVEAIVDACAYERKPAALTRELIDEACTTYFLRPMNAPA